AAVPGDHGRASELWRRRARRIPEHLRVLVRVDVDEAGRDAEACGCTRLTRRLVEPTHRDDATVAYADVRALRRRARAVDDETAGDGEVEHRGIVTQSGVPRIEVDGRQIAYDDPCARDDDRVVLLC